LPIPQRRLPATCSLDRLRRQRRGGPSADISLTDASATLIQTGTSGWTLNKSGSLNGNTVTWKINAKQVDTTNMSGYLLFNGQITIFNSGSAPATLGNIVVNLKKRVGNKWMTGQREGVRERVRLLCLDYLAPPC